MSNRRCSICNSELQVVNDRLVCVKCKAEYMLESFGNDEMPTEFHSVRTEDSFQRYYHKIENSNQNYYENFGVNSQEKKWADQMYEDYDATTYDSVQSNSKQDQRLSGFQSRSMNGYQDSSMSGYQDSSMSGYQDSGVSGYQDSSMSGYQDPSMNGYQDSNVNGYQDSSMNGYYDQSGSGYFGQPSSDMVNGSDIIYRDNYGSHAPTQMPKDMSVKKRWIIIGSVILGALLIEIIPILISLGKLNKNGQTYNTTGNQTTMNSSSNQTGSTASTGNSSNSNLSNTNSSSTQVGKLEMTELKGTMIEELVYKAFGCTLDQVTKEQLDSVIEITFKPDGYGENIVTYTLKQGETGKFVSIYDSFEGGYCAVFSNLEKLDLEVGEIKTEYLSTLDHLQELYGNFYRADVDSWEKYCNVTKIKRLGLYDSYYTELDFSPFTQVEFLMLDMRTTMGEYDNLKKIDSLKGLDLRVEGQSDVTFLYEMTGLEALYITHTQLKEIGFIKNMPNLTELGICETKITDLSPVEAVKDQLTVFIFKENYEVSDYEMVTEMVNLEKLELHCRVDSFDIPMPDLSRLQNLKSLYLHDYGILDSLEKLTNLEKLTFHHILADDYTPIRSLKNLKAFTLYNCSLDPPNIDDITSLENIEYLNLEDSYGFCDMTDLFLMPNLKWMNCYRTRGGLNVERISSNDSIAYLNLENSGFVKLREDGTYNWGDEISYTPEEIATMFPNFTGLVYLSYPNNQLNSLDTLSNLKKLEILNIEDTYVTDLSPLKGAPLRAIYCNSTPIVETAGFDQVLIK